MPLAAFYRSPQLLDPAPRDRVHWLDLPPGRPGIGAARSAAAAWLGTWKLPEGVCEDAVLVLSELATNALRHTASSNFLCCVGLTAGDLVHLEVHDRGPLIGSLDPRSPGLDDEGGRGLLLVQHLSRRWGVARSVITGGNAVWARLGAG
ncbi:ATP-binding protein [Streptomyces sp. HPF1205]|uniref:ATP-binding protein n=1 Tax=Streptomyces sp. HPF1205 TaxID=2873262 RepID=UPI001CEDDE7D|nr:ATP-binding protein [Streptomyces sp. HPF1205]